MQDERVIELLSGSLDGMLSAEETTELETALASSSQAQELLALMTSDKEALRALPGLRVPDNLKQRGLLKARAQKASSGVPWRRLMMAASLLVAVGLGFYILRPLAAVRSRLHLRPGQLAMKAAQVSEELSLAAAGANTSHVMLSQAVTGSYTGGPTHFHLQCDAGEAEGGRLSVRLAFDFDGDGDFDAHSEPQVLEVDGKEGYQELAYSWPALDGMRDLENGKVQVELASSSDKGPPLKVKFQPEQARLDLPFDRLTSPDEVAT